MCKSNKDVKKRNSWKLKAKVFQRAGKLKNQEKKKKRKIKGLPGGIKKIRSKNDNQIDNENNDE